MSIIFKTEITAMSSDGCGVGRVDGKVVFVPYTAIGDYIEAVAVKTKKSFIHGELLKIITESPDRVSVDCEYFNSNEDGLTPRADRCGGCDFRHISYEAELKIKAKFIKDAFTKLGKLEPEFLPIIPSRDINFYRNNVQFQVGKDEKENLIYGFYAPKSKVVVPHKNCKLYPAEFTDITEKALEFFRGQKIPRQICVRKGHYSGEINAVADRKITLIGENEIKDTICGIKVIISPQSFYQVNTPAAEELYGVIKKFAAPKDKTILDLYCGTGTIGLSLADEAKEIIGIECVEAAVKNAVKNAEINKIDNARFICADASELPEKTAPDLVILDPARRGCDSLVLEKVANLKPERIIMVSCEPATAARDCAMLEAFGYTTVRVQGVDLFPRTRHVECVAELIIP